MKRVLSTYLFSARPLTQQAVVEAAGAGAEAIELFCAPGHFDYRSVSRRRELAGWLERAGLVLHSVHAPTENDHPGRGGTPLSIAEPERVRRLQAVDEIKRVLELAETVPFGVLVLHLGPAGQPADPRCYDAAFSSVEHLLLFARPLGIALALENLPGELAAPAQLVAFLQQTHLEGVGLCFDTGHAHLGDGVEASFEAMRPHLLSTHVHDNRGARDDHLVPFEGALPWPQVMALLATAPRPLPLVLELKEPEPGAAAGVLRKLPGVFSRLEELAAAAARPEGGGSRNG